MASPSVATVRKAYIIVGGGTTGLVVANRLSASPHHIVMVIEPGPDERADPSVTDPFRWTETQDTVLDWAYDTTPQTNVNGRVLQYHAGRLIGGTSATNGLNYIRPDAELIDAWEELGATGWNWNTLWPYFKRSERFIRPDPEQQSRGATYDAASHGEAGEVKIGWMDAMREREFYNMMKATWAAMGVQTRQDPNGGRLEGFGARPWTVDAEAGFRESAATAFYHPVASRPNLRVVRGTVIKLVWGKSSEGRQVATGVEYLDHKTSRRLLLSLDQGGEVILAAGALRSPPILEASGIGNPAVLGKLGVDVKVDLPGVGGNLQDQANLLMTLKGGSAEATGYAPYAAWVTADHIFGDELGSIAASTKSDLSRWASEMASASPGISAEGLERALFIQHNLIFNKGISAGEIITTGSADTLVAGFWSLLPFSRGSVHLRSQRTEDVDRPIIDPGFFRVPFDMQYFTALGRLARTFWTEEPVKQIVAGFIRPDQQTLPLDASPDQWAAFARTALTPNYHAVGTAAMMSRNLGGVVDPELRVYGTANVRVVDASILPLQGGGHLVATLYAIAEKAADLMLRSPGPCT